MSKKDKAAKLMPRLRFPEFQEADPWTPKTLAQTFGTITNGKANAQDHDEEGEFPLFDRSETIKRSPEYLFDAEAVILPGEGAHFTPRRFGGKFNLHQRAYALMDCREDIDFAYYAMDEGKGRLANKAVKSTVLSLRMPIIEKFTIACPSPAEQRKIAECLGSLDEWIAAETDALALLRRHKTGLMQQLFPKPDETRPLRRFEEFRDAGDWSTEPFEKLYDFKPNNTYSRDQLNYEYGTVRNIHYGDIHTRFATQFRLADEHVPFVNDDVLPEEINPDALCQHGDIIFADASEDLADVGKSIEIIDLSGQQVLSGSHTILARPRAGAFVIGFGGYLFKSRYLRERIEKEAQGTKVMQISPRRLSSVQVCFPSDHTEQEHIANTLASLDAHIAAREKHLIALHEHKKGLMQQLFPASDDRAGEAV